MNVERFDQVERCVDYLDPRSPRQWGARFGVTTKFGSAPNFSVFDRRLDLLKRWSRQYIAH